MRFAVQTLVLALGIGGIVGYVVHHSGTGAWTRKWGYLPVLALIAGAVLVSCSGGK
ncbi:hypothetical protein [Petropleomorpha daqingensis]|uniref:Uncharacterized protein n=1 Tax=Petropleomorpha daqingensis TaxID=2026353 RepID=A0A853CAH0_9ACTN|nr:hypothetical protein [Petropleomorpha daqingensis]NYJ04664.1 hypothetical protein [Petropleomorpha daqingensis]